MKPALRLVVDQTPEFCGLIEAMSDLLNHEASSSNAAMDIRRSTYRHGNERCLAIYVENLDSGAQIRIVFDQYGLHAGRQGMHTTLEIDEYELCDKLTEADSQGFDTIWVHS
jgi:hypothetical protein